MAFFPLAAETFGGWHCVGEREIKKLGSALARHTGQEESEAVHHLWGRLGILLHGETLRFWETGSPTSHHHKLMD